MKWTWSNLYWGQSKNQLGSEYIYCLSWIERDGDYNIVENFVTLEDLEKGKTSVAAIAKKHNLKNN